MRWTLDAARGVLTDENQHSLARVTDHALIGAGSQNKESAHVAPSLPVVVWSGTMSDDGPFEPHVRNWSPAAWTLVRERLKTYLSPESEESGGNEGGGGVWLRPHAAHIVSDIPSCVRFLEIVRDLRDAGSAASTTGILVDPLSMLSPQMATSPNAADYLVRVCDWLADQQALGTHGIVAVVVSTGPQNTPQAAPDAPRRAALSDKLRQLLDQRGVAWPRAEM